MVYPMVLALYVDAKVSLERIRDYLLAEELDNVAVTDMDAENAINIDNGTFAWETAPPAEVTKASKKAEKKRRKSKKWRKKKTKDAVDTASSSSPPSTRQTDSASASAAASVAVEASDQPLRASLRNINLQIPRGSLVAVVGSVGSGKSSLLNALVGEMKCLEGSVVFGGSVGYCPQTAWIQNATVRDNITFGLPYDEAKYRAVIRDCALERDLDILPDGDFTEIGERGINLSGGQKQRLNIARAVYFGADIILLDDPLSAVDAHVARHLFERCIQGALANRTRVLVTHQLHFVRHADYVLYMENGEIKQQGSFEQLSKESGAFAQLISEYGGADDEKTSDDEDASGGSGDDTDIEEEKKKPAKTSGQALMTVEERATGAVAAAVYKSYIRAGGGWKTVRCLTLALTMRFDPQCSNDLWLSWWSGDELHLSMGQYMGVYAGWGVAQMVAGILFGISLAYLCARASKTLHDDAINNVFRAPMSFFDTTPLGRIINRFSKDMDSVDNQLIEALRMFTSTLAITAATFLMICVVFPIFLAPLVPLLCLYYYFQLFYRATSRELKRIDSVTRSPLYAHFGETLTGLATIRAYREQNRFIGENEQLMDTTNRPYYLSFTIQRWLGMRLEAIANILTFFVSIFTVISRTSVSPGLIGLVMSYSLQVTGTLNWCVRQAAEVEVNMNAVERLEYYAQELDQEAPAVLPDNRPDERWPSRGAIEINQLELAYRKGLPNVLHGVSASIRGGEKIGVVGRTGAGKSSIMVALFRLVEVSGGSISIDGVDISSLGLRDLRSRLAIIPQDPTLFHGTVRSNLDPFSRYTDQELWDALDRADMKTYVAGLADGLDAEVSEGGENFSAGQRQLVCLARAILVHARILIMDEATASVDMRTDALLQKAIREDFAGCTILTIAHRLNTVIDYDR
ncbi:putative ATP-binding cassette transporter protein YOR1 [Thamnocephalis sphaerospora]|uniref:Putative ATP-binding cassette transporter protein YOR1 n=1 Tax=Thamnocephalis sphaerospora TaxID=78915 RepID=A0A4P9XSS9_9FUNG|nr:putative ATP-binding cassette transporter protein YOR1 [Thamnocephalis sphaerospora]|eukprot:RKP09032.1 putative ATP-binding cassette transporter protein YOR1 [Thamnocephalis sphaerospora]